MLTRTRENVRITHCVVSTRFEVQSLWDRVSIYNFKSYCGWVRVWIILWAGKLQFVQNETHICWAFKDAEVTLTWSRFDYNQKVFDKTLMTHDYTFPRTIDVSEISDGIIPNHIQIIHLENTWKVWILLSWPLSRNLANVLSREPVSIQWRRPYQWNSSTAFIAVLICRLDVWRYISSASWIWLALYSFLNLK